MSSPVATALHEWVKMTEQRVEVIVDPVSGEAFTVTQESEPIGECVGCVACGEALTDFSAVTPCSGEIDLP